MGNITRREIIATLSIMLLPISFGVKARVLSPFKKSVLNIESSGNKYTFNVEIAEDGKQHAMGLMYRRTLAPDAGMLFDYHQSQRISMWMKNTFIPLDMLFIAADGRIVNIVERTIPHSETVISSHGKVKGVLEVNGGTVERLGIKPGDYVRHGIFK